MKVERLFRFQPGFLFLAPVFDLALVLGFYLLLSSTFLLQPGVAVEVPKSPFLLAPQNHPAVLSITGPPRPALFWKNSEISQALLAQELDALQERGGTLIIKADRLVPYELIHQVSQLALTRQIPVVLAGDNTP